MPAVLVIDLNIMKNLPFLL